MISEKYNLGSDVAASEGSILGKDYKPFPRLFEPRTSKEGLIVTMEGSGQLTITFDLQHTNMQPTSQQRLKNGNVFT